MTLAEWTASPVDTTDQDLVAVADPLSEASDPVNDIVRLHRLGGYRACVVAAFRLARVRPTDSRVWALLVDSLSREGEYEQALTSVAAGLRMIPGSAMLNYLRAQVLVRQERDTEAEAAYRFCLASEPGYHPARFRLALLLGRTGRPDEAVTLLARHVGRDRAPALLNLQLGAHYLERGDFVAARAAMVRSITLAPGLAPAYEALGRFEIDLGDIRVAEAASRHAARIAPGNVRYRALWSRALMLMGRDQEAIRLLKDSIALNPAEAGSYYALALALVGVMENGAASRLRLQGQRLDPTHARAGEVNLGHALWGEAEQTWFLG